jgi:PAS domain S-box-containing protein
MKKERSNIEVTDELRGRADKFLAVKGPELGESEAHFRQLFESAADAIFLHDRGKIVEVNEQACRSLGYSREELLRLHITDIEVGIDQRDLLEGLKHDPSEKTFFGTQRRKDGSSFPVEIRTRSFPTQDRDLWFAVVRDMTAQRQAEQAIRENEKLFRSLFENMLNGFAYCKMLFEHNQPQDFIYLEVNSAFEAMTGLENVVGKKVSEVIPGLRESDPELFEIYGRVALTGKPERFENYVEALKIWFSISVYCPAKEYFVAVFDVITERKQAEAALRHSRETLRALIDATPAGVMLLDTQGIILAANKELAQKLGTTIKEMVGTCLFDYLSSALALVRQNRWAEIKRCRQPLCFEDNHAGRTFDIYVHPIFSPTGELTGFAVLSVDITARKQAEEALAQQSRFLQLLIDTIPTPVFYKDEQERYLGCNKGFLEYHGLTKEEILGKTVDCLPAKDLVEKYRQKDLELFRNPGVQVHENAMQLPDGSEREVVFNKATFLKADGAVGGLIGVITDITELKQAQKELRALAARLAEMEEKGRHILARELHDEVGQGLTALGLNLTLIQTQMPQDAAAPLLNRLSDAVALVEKTGETIRNVMAELRPPVLDDYGLLSALRWYGGEFSRRTNIGVEVQGEETAPRLARSVELALFRIAQEALTNVAKHAEATEVVLSQEIDNGTVRLIIADNGVGFNQTRMGQPEGRYRWGLMNMSERAAAAGGRCRIESQLGHGTRVVVEVSR